MHREFVAQAVYSHGAPYGRRRRHMWPALRLGIRRRTGRDQAIAPLYGAGTCVRGAVAAVSPSRVRVQICIGVRSKTFFGNIWSSKTVQLDRAGKQEGGVARAHLFFSERRQHTLSGGREGTCAVDHGFARTGVKARDKSKAGCPLSWPTTPKIFPCISSATARTPL